MKSYDRFLKSLGVCAVSATMVFTCVQAFAAESQAVQMKEVVVEDTIPAEGTAEQGYRVDNVKNVGPWGEKKLVDLPYSISVLSSDLIENTQSVSPEEIFKYSPYTQVYIQASRFADNTNLRGWYNNLRLSDGMRIFGTNQTLEDKERVEIITGYTGFLYGLSNPAGAINYVLKRPTAQPMAELTLRTVDGEDAYIHADLGGPIDKEGKFGYRLNLAYQNGGTFVDHQEVNKHLISGTVDWNVSKDLLLQFEASNYYKKSEGMQVAFSGNGYYSTYDLDELDLHKLYGQKWSFQEDEYTVVGTRMKWDIAKPFTLRAAVRYSETSNERLNVNSGGFDSLDGTYTQSLYHISPTEGKNWNTYLYLDSKFKTWFIDHTLTAGVAWDFSDTKASPDRTKSMAIPGTFSFDNPTYVDKPDYTVGTQSKEDYQKIRYRNTTIGDDIKFNDSWSALVGFSYSEINTTTYNLNTGDGTTYDKGKATPSLALMYKPKQNITTYVSYLEALQQGGTAPETYMGNPVTNAGEQMKPSSSKQTEIGAKAQIGGTLLTAAVFKMEEANQYTDPDSLTYVQDGRTEYKGLELTATGKIIPDLTVITGITLLNVEVKEYAVDKELEGKTPANLPEKLGKIYAEYNLPFFRPLTITGGAFYTGSYYEDDMEEYRVSSATTYDLGARYTTAVAKHPLVLRANVSNITDEKYYSSYGYTGDPRYFTLSATLSY